MRVPGCLAALLLLAGCGVVPHAGVDATRFYTLSTPAAPANEIAPSAARVLVRQVELPPYLQRKAFAVRQAGNEVGYIDKAWWSEPLDLGIARVLRERLGQAGIPNGSRRDQDYDYEVRVRVTACEGELAAEKGKVRFAATIELLRSGETSDVVARRNFTANEAAWNGTDYGVLAKLLSRAIADLGTQVVEIVAQKK